MSVTANQGRQPSDRARLISLDSARWKLALIWFPACGLVFLILIGQSIGQVYGDELQRVWSWALPNFLPTLALMVSVFAADALRPYESTAAAFVRKSFYLLSAWLSGFYLFVFLLSFLVQPFLQLIRGGTAVDAAERIELLETSNYWLGPLQGIVVLSLGVLFFLKENDPDEVG